MTATPTRPARPIRRVGVVAKQHLRAAASVLADVDRWLEARGIAAVFETDTARLAGLPTSRPVLDRDALVRAVDLLLVLGGDGTLLGMAGRVAQAGVDVPILGVNFGSLGFLTEVTLAELYPSLEAVLAGTAELDERRMLRAVIDRAHQRLADRIVLNDVVVTKGALARIIELAVSVSDRFVTRIRADGLIVASPTGSTAYNLAAGGPIVHPDVDALVVTPIAPHTLSNRPVVIPATAEVGIQPLVDLDDEVYVTFDGQSGLQLQGGDLVTVSAAPQTMKLVKASTRDYFALLREKLNWGG
jgi:NAD+ kinase